MASKDWIVSKDYLNTKNQWIATIQVAFPIDEFDLHQIFDDDTEIDYMQRAWGRFRATLEELIEEKKISSYRLREVPHRLDIKDDGGAK
tara:strand:- start:222 stop:488 length:267 start_codon:yes stop_codon:yes gene_type:complete